MSLEIFLAALGGMPAGPRPLVPALRFAADDEGYDVEALRAELETATPGDEVLGLLRRKLAGWDNETAPWAEGTAPNTAERRAFVYTKLRLDEAWIQLCETRLPFKPLSRPTVIATEHEQWYTPEIQKARRFYWDAYSGQLKRERWLETSIDELDISTSSIVERLADPTSEGAYQAKGLVVGYVQSGKTANFTGVIAKAADAGYRLIIVLGGMLDVLRSQTQRRIDKELIGRELLGREYVDDPDWDEFLGHGARPSALGAFDWSRLTGPEEDYQSLAYGVEALKFDAHDPALPFYNPDNLHRAPARIAVLKKNSKVVERLLRDLNALERRGLGSPLDQIPTLIIDDESDQGGINTRAPAGPDEEQERTATNRAIVALLRLLPRAQYVGYTATPFANVFIDPADESDIFPKDFLIALPRPQGYMGVADFYDLDAGEEDEKPNKRDLVREVTGNDDLPKNLQRAIDSFVLAGALKLWRTDADPDLKFRHHTMLVHVSERQSQHKALAAKVRSIYAKAAYDGGAGLDRLKVVFDEDYAPVHSRRGGDLPFPEAFDELLPFIGNALSKVGEADDAVSIVNTEHRQETPDFDKRPIWKILVGGAKLSRGFTVEGLTVSYYRRRAGAGDTLMQMGRWFGFRRGYDDLVRLYIGVAEPVGTRGKTINLYEAFEGVCRDEELFRRDLVRYASMDEPRITPAKIPPLVPQHLLRPTAPNKMRNAALEFRNFGSALAESTFAPSRPDHIAANNALFDAVLKGKEVAPAHLSGQAEQRRYELDTWTALVSNDEVIRILHDYTWYDPGTRESRNPNPLQLQVDFLKGAAGPHGIGDWLLLAPKVKGHRAEDLVAGHTVDVVFRSRHQDQPWRFHTYNDPKHRAIARHISSQELLDQPNSALEALRRPNRGVMLFYRITDTPTGKKPTPPFTSGFTLLFPPNDLPTPLGFTVRHKGEPDEAVITLAT